MVEEDTPEGWEEMVHEMRAHPDNITYGNPITNLLPSQYQKEKKD
jgi:hypothetical protein